MSNPDSTTIVPLSSPRLVLASASPRRRELLSGLGVPFEVIASNIEESIAPDLTAETQAISLAAQKAWAIGSSLETGIVLGADTIVVLDGMLLGKPEDDADAFYMLRSLSGRDHHVVTGMALLDAATGSLATSAVSTVVRVRSLIDDEIAAYVATSEPRDKAGAYAIQGIGADLISGLEGCFTNVIGLPLCETADLLRRAGVFVHPMWPGCNLPDGRHCPRQV